MTSLIPLLKKESQYTLDKESYEGDIQMEEIYKQNLVNSIPKSNSDINVHVAGNSSKRTSVVSTPPPPSPKLTKLANDKRRSKRLSRLSQQISMQTKYLAPSKPKIKRWKLYEGKSKMFLHGRIVTGNDSILFLLSTNLITVPCILFMIFVMPEYNSLFFYIIFAYLTIFCTASLLKTSWTDPGILPRNLEPLPNEVHLNFNSSSSSLEMPESSYSNSANLRYQDTNSPYSSTSYLNKNQNQNTLASTYPFISPAKSFIPSMRNIVVNGRIVSQKFCDTCKIYRPPRSFHCCYCDNCVENCDHHCPWTANCIGKRNYRYFYAFICSSTILSFIVLFGSINFIYRKIKQKGLNVNFDSLMTCLTEHPVPYVLAFIIIIIGWFNTFMSGYHTYLICKNITTHEQLKEQYIPNTNKSYFTTDNVFKNILLVLFRPVAPARYAMRQYISIPSKNNDSAIPSNSPIVNPFLSDPPNSNSNNYCVNVGS
ncbi:zf-DHHC-domain-containing protein [Piromyces finnis]|uniref:Palmitoyltransferase n=1 Tax=Piromyces finnis TaxID=1754191 RepID=A0A1Y1VI55_9FUNG|nr:zf-DHHC-domain-containing protein [Piromyces finnis]|eukprot:ORX56644.1 zf-DHHC-domain-containing protein [Piromyces finnis]